jgi:adenylylsulfate kinase
VRLRHLPLQSSNQRGTHGWKETPRGLSAIIVFGDTDTANEQVAKLFADSSTIAITSFISPYKADRETARSLHVAPSAAHPDDEPLPFIEVFVDIPLEEAEKRDPKGLYKKAREGKIPEFTGISAPYEAPENAEITIRSDKTSVEEAVVKIVEYLNEKGLLELRSADGRGLEY